MSYPTLEQYNEAFQAPKTALIDSELKNGSVATTGLGLPLALCGGFALTYTITSGTKKFAVRCFHKKSNALEKRYHAISSRLISLNSPYFVDFEFQPEGVRVSGRLFPIVKMTWASGITLGEFIEKNHRDGTKLNQLRDSMQNLAKYLQSKNMAHGDIQPGNVMVSDSGKKTQLIDYDGIFVDELKGQGSSELGHRNFQHPKRSSNSWDASLDRFSFIAIDLALRALSINPELWIQTQSDGDSIVFKANDFADPTHSAVFARILSIPQLSEEATNFASICNAPFEKTPTLEDFVSKRNIPLIGISVAAPTKNVASQYLSAFPVLDAIYYNNCLSYVGDKVELIGKIVEVKENKTRHGKPYIFINFGPWQGSIVKISIWSEGLVAISNKPTESWIGKWISVVGLMEPPYVSRQYEYSHLAISITQGSQFHIITEKEAKFRLSGSSNRGTVPIPRGNNKAILDRIHNGEASRPVGRTLTPSLPSSKGNSTPSKNQAVLEKIQERKNQQGNNSSKAGWNYSNNSSNSNCFIATAVYGPDSPETNILRLWRDSVLMPTAVGRALVSVYYTLSPLLVPFVKKSRFVNVIARTLLDKIVLKISQRL